MRKVLLLILLATGCGEELQDEFPLTVEPMTLTRGATSTLTATFGAGKFVYEEQLEVALLESVNDAGRGRRIEREERFADPDGIITRIEVVDALDAVIEVDVRLPDDFEFDEVVLYIDDTDEGHPANRGFPREWGAATLRVE